MVRIFSKKPAKALVTCASSTLFVVLMLVVVNARAQDMPIAPAPGPDVESLSPDEMSRINKKREMDRALAKIREMFARGEYQAVITEIENARKIDPANASLQLYRKWAEEKMVSAEAQPDSDPSATPGLGSSIGLSPPPRSANRPSVTPPPAQTTPVASAGSTPAPLPVATPAAAEAPQPSGSGSSTSRNFLIAAAVLGLLVALGAVASKFIGRKKGASVPEAADEEQEEETFQPRGLLIPNPLTGEVNLSPQDIAANIEKSGQTAPSNEPPPTFDIYIPEPGEGERLPADHEDMPTMVDAHIDHVGPAPDSGPAFADAQPTPEARPVPPPVPAAAPAMQSISLSHDDMEGHGEVLLKPGVPPPVKSGFGAGETVSFDDLGIVLLNPGAQDQPVAPQVPAPPPPQPASPPNSFLQAATPMPEPGVSTTPIMEVPNRPAPPPEPPPVPERDSSADPIRLDSIDFTFSNPGEAAKPDLLVESKKNPTGAIDLEDLLKHTIDGAKAKIGSPPGSAPDTPATSDTPTTAVPSTSQENRGAEIDTLFIQPSALDNQKEEEPPKSTSRMDETYGFAADTFHSQDTIQLSPPTDERRDEDLAATQTYSGSNSQQASSAMAETVGTSEPAPPPPQVAPPPVAAEPESFYGTTPPRGTAGLDERSERMFREQYDRGMKAYNDKNWKQAVHYLSIASAIHPDNEDVRSKLREAREMKRKDEVKA